MELRSVIRKRRSIRKFKNKDVSKTMVNDLIRYAILAPSAKNRQPWKFIVVKNELKDQIADIMIKKEEKSKVSMERKIYRANSSVISTAKIIKQAPVLILVLREPNKNWQIRRHTFNRRSNRTHMLKSSRLETRFFMDKRYSIC